jgi:hypothetical protein
MLSIYQDVDIIRNALGISGFWYGLHEFVKKVGKSPSKGYAQLIYKIIEIKVEQWPKYQH